MYKRATSLSPEQGEGWKGLAKFYEQQKLHSREGYMSSEVDQDYAPAEYDISNAVSDDGESIPDTHFEMPNNNFY